MKVWIIFAWLRIRTSGEILWTQWWTIGFQWRRRISRKAERLLVYVLVRWPISEKSDTISFERREIQLTL